MEKSELEDWDGINQNGGTLGTGINRAIHKLVIAIFNSGSKTSGQVMHLSGHIKELNDNLVKSSKSSENLTNSIRNATWTAAIIGGLGVLIAAISLMKGICY